MSGSLTKREVVELTGRSASWVERHAEELAPTAGPTGRNGRPVPLFDLAALPAAAQAAWAGESRRKVIEIAPALGGDGSAQMALALTVPCGPNLSAEDRAEAERRYAVIEALVEPARFPLLVGKKRGAVVAYLAKAYRVKGRTIYRWWNAFQADGLPGLVRKDRADKGSARAMTDAARDFLIALSCPRPGVTGILRVAEMYRAYEEERVWRGGDALPKISGTTFRIWFERIPEIVRTLAREGGEAYRNTQEIISHRDIAAVDPLDYVVMDHRRLDVFCLVRERGGWKLARPWLTAAIDMRTRLWMGWAIVETPSSDAIATVLKQVFVRYGLPKACYWDNGKDFTCEWFEGRHRRARQAGRIAELDDTWRGVLGTLGIRVHHAIVRNARAKLIEPNFLRVSNVDRALPEWCGHNPGARPEAFDELVASHEAWVKGERATTPFRTIGEIASLYNAAMRDLNERPLEGEGMRKTVPGGYGWMSPAEVWQELAAGVPRREVPEDLLHMCFAKRRKLTVQHGEIATTHDGRVYRYRMADSSVRLMALNGKAVELAYDPLDLADGAVYFESRFQGIVRCVELRRMGETAFVQDERDRRAARREVKRAIAAAHRLAPAISYEERLARRAEVRPERETAARCSMPAELPTAVAEATAAMREEARPVAPVVVETVAAAPRGEDDGDFNFFA
jgi:transposase InsO family protein